MLKTAQMPVFLLGVLLPETKNIINIVGLGFRGKKNIGIYGVVCSENLKINANTPPIWRFSATTKQKKIAGVTTTTTTSNDNNNNTVIFGRWGAKNLEYCCVFYPEGF